jgi:hypothetical protein
VRLDIARARVTPTTPIGTALTLDPQRAAAGSKPTHERDVRRIERGLALHSSHSSRVVLFPNQGYRRSVNVLAPRSRPAKSSSMYLLIPSTIETTAMRNITPIVTPISVKKLFSF